MNALIQGFEAVWQVPDVAVVLLSGLITGFVSAWLVSSPHIARTMRWYILHPVVMIAVLSAPFWLGRTAVALVNGDPVWGRVVAAMVLTMFYALWVGAGLAIGLRLRHRRYRRVNGVATDHE